MKHLFLTMLVAVVLASCNNTSNNAAGDDKHTGGDMLASNKEGCQGFMDKVINAHNPAMVDSFCAANFVEHSPSPGYPADREGLKKSFADFFAGFPDLTIKPEFMVAEGDYVVVHFQMKGTNSGPMMGMQPTGKTMDIHGVDVIKIKDGKATDHWGYFEEGKMMQQMGMMPDMSKEGDKKMEAPKKS